jgi:glycerol-3-phosphate acyltransferase PlsY
VGYILVALLGYFLGSIPTGFLVAKAKGVDIRTVGSKNMGATNVFRVLGKGPGIFVLFVDALKGAVAVALVFFFYPALSRAWPEGFGTDTPENHAAVGVYLEITAGIFAVLGHNYTFWLWFKGGKGIATTAGVYAALAPAAVGIALAVWIILVAMTRYVSVASIGAAAALPVAVWCTTDNLALRIVTLILGLLAIVKHKENIKRLRAGTERKFGEKPPEATK